MTSPANGYILELTPPEDSQYHNEYMHDVVKWRFTISETSTIPGYFYLNDRLILNTPKSTITFVSDATSRDSSGSKTEVYNSPYAIRGSKESHAAPPFRSDEREVLLSDLGKKGDYTAYVDVPGGSNEPSFKVLIDSGSSTLWLFGENYQVEPTLTPHQDYIQPPDRITYYAGATAECHGTREFEVTYVDNSFVKGGVYNDYWDFPTLAGTTLRTRPLFGVANIVANRFAMGKIDGILGLGYYQGAHFSGTQPETFISTLRATKLIKNYMYCICFRKGRPGRSFLSLGCIPPDVPRPRYWIPVVASERTWVVHCQGFGWGEDPNGRNFDILQRQTTVVLDSGTTHCFFPMIYLDFVRAKLGGRQTRDKPYIEFPSRGFGSKEEKSLWICLGGMWFKWPSNSLYGELSEAAKPPHRAWYASRLHCNGEFDKNSILGAVFFEYYYAYFDADPNRPSVALEPQ